jgi:hypothetical protein
MKRVIMVSLPYIEIATNPKGQLLLDNVFMLYQEMLPYLFLQQPYGYSHNPRLII